MKKGARGSIIGIIIFIMVLVNIFGESISFLPTIVTISISLFIFGGGTKFIKKMEEERQQNIKDSEIKKDDVFENQQVKSNKEYSSRDNDSRYEDVITNNKPSFSKRCKKCNSLISSDDRYCPECGASQNNTIICEYCGHENPASNALCEKCNGFL